MPRLATLPLVALLAALPAAPAAAQDSTVTPVRVRTPGGEIVSANAADHARLYGEWHFAPARVEGDRIVVSGVVAGSRDGQPLDVAGFEAALRRVWGRIGETLAAAGASHADIVDLTTFHVFGSPLFRGTKAEHLTAFRKVKDEYVREPYPTWTGIGIAELFAANGLVEIRVVARRPGAPAPR